MKNTIHSFLKRNFFKVTGTMAEHFPVAQSFFVYFLARKKVLHLHQPRDLNEKFMWLKLNIYNYHPLAAICADKYAMREYVKEKGCQELLIPLYGVWETTEDIPFEQLPDSFVMKCNHGCGMNLICRDKTKLDKEKMNLQLNMWMKWDYWRRSAELQYKHIPRRIICEKYIGKKEATLPDYKVMCFNGEPQYILYCDGRENHLRYINYSMDWELLPYNDLEEDVQIPKPFDLDKMIAYAKVLSKDFPAVRLDFYQEEGQWYIGEMTFTPAACISIALSQEGLDYFGKSLNLKHQKAIKMYQEAQKYKQSERKCKSKK